MPGNVIINSAILQLCMIRLPHIRNHYVDSYLLSPFLSSGQFSVPSALLAEFHTGKHTHLHALHRVNTPERS